MQKSRNQKHVSDPSQNDVMEKIEKLIQFAIRDAATESERMVALDKVHDLLMKRDPIQEQTSDCQFSQRDVYSFSMRSGHWGRLCATHIGDLNHCQFGIIRDGSKTRNFLVGRRGNVVTAKSLTDYIVSNIAEESLRVSKWKHDRNEFAKSFRWGAAMRIAERCSSLMQQYSTPTRIEYTKNENRANQNFLNEHLLGASPTNAKCVVFPKWVDPEGHDQGVSYGDHPGLHRQIRKKQIDLRSGG